MTDDAPRPQLNVAAAMRAERRSRADGPWNTDHLRLCWVVVAAVAVAVCVPVGIVVGSRGLAGSMTGFAVVGAFFTLSTIVVAWIGARAPEMVLAAALGTYVLKIAALGMVLILLPRNGPIDPRWMAIAVVIGLVAWLSAHLRYIWTAKLYYTDPSAQAASHAAVESGGGHG